MKSALESNIGKDEVEFPLNPVVKDSVPDEVSDTGSTLMVARSIEAPNYHVK